MFRTHVLIVRRSKLHYTASAIITPVGVRLMHKMTTYRCDDTRGCVMQFWPSDDEHMCLKHVEAWNKLIVKQKFCASSWLITETNILRCTVSKTSKSKCVCYLFWNSIKKQKQNTFDLQLLYQNQRIMQIHNSEHHNSKGSDRFKFCIMYKITLFAFKKLKQLIP